MSEVPDNLKYSSEHEWVRLEDDGSVVVGITDHAQAALGELVYVEVPEAGQTFNKGDACIVVESVKAASDVYAPVSGACQAANPALGDAPELVNQSPYEGGWLVRLQPSDPAELDELMDAEAYARLLAESGG
ncbi:MAG: glycine cleavage system protein GcvH [Gammaproteobacteria bacterium]|nr:MAG: glycine cleavage system protein GcvH [Gammaproteobacteria bacterium]